MAVLEKLRVKFGMAVSIIIALGLLSFIIDPNELISAFNGMSSKYDVGEINGKSVSYNDFQEDVQRFSTINEFMTGSSAQGAAGSDQKYCLAGSRLQISFRGESKRGWSRCRKG